MSLTDNLIQKGWLKTPSIVEAFREIERANFMPDDSKSLADLNKALPIGWGQTISQPLVVAFMLEKLQPKLGEKILDIGAGSGWTSALLAQIVGLEGKIVAIEIIPELKEFGQINVSKYNFIKKGVVEFICADASKGYLKEAPYDKILCSAEAKKLPLEWKAQLKIGGQIVTSIGSSICVFVKKSKKEFEKEDYPGFVFVPLINS